MLHRALLLALVFVLVGSVAYAKPAPAQDRNAIDDMDDAQDCSEWVPEQATVPVVGDYETPVSLEVLFLLNRMDTYEGEEIAAEIAKIYAPLGIELVPFFEQVDWEADTTEPSTLPGGEPAQTIGSGTLMQNAKEHVGGARPWGIDLVYVMSGVEISSFVAGQADCIGGIRYDDRAFGVGEAGYPDGIHPNWTRRFANIAAHEIAHLLGAHHHYANCAQGDTVSLTRLYLTICTLMFNDISLVSGFFSTAEAAVVRGHALEYAVDTPMAPPLPHERTIDLNLRGATAEGSVSVDDGFFECTVWVPVDIQVKRKSGWETLTSAWTSDTGSFEEKIGKRPGTYRAVAPETAPEDARRGETCAAAVSETKTRR